MDACECIYLYFANFGCVKGIYLDGFMDFLWIVDTFVLLVLQVKTLLQRPWHLPENLKLLVSPPPPL